MSPNASWTRATRELNQGPRSNVSAELLQLMENLFSCCYSCVKWDGILSETFSVSFDARQGSVLSPFMFALYLDLASVCDLNQSCSIFCMLMIFY